MINIKIFIIAYLLIKGVYSLTCTSPQVLDVYSNTCLADKSQCNQGRYYISDLNTCQNDCPLGYFRNKDHSTLLNICIKISFICDITSQVMYVGERFECLQQNDLQRCNQMQVVDKNNVIACLPFCPQGFTQGSGNDSNKCYSSNNPNFSWLNHPFWNCQFGIRDVSTLECYNSIDQCPSFYNDVSRSCLQFCYDNYSFSQQYNKQLCSQWTMAQCTSPNFLFFHANKCILNNSECYDYVIKDANGFKLCWPTCPPGFTSSIDSSTGIKYCTPPTNIILQNSAIFSCYPPNVIDTVTFQCLDQISDCNKITVNSRYLCVDICPNGYQFQYSQATQKQYCTQSQNCKAPYILHYLNNQCINQSDCHDYLLTYKDRKICLPECPSSPFVAGYDQTLQIKTCTLNNQDYDFDSLAISNCNQPKVRDFTTASCLNNQSDCKAILVNSFTCLSSCPNGYSLSTSSSGQKMCNNFNNNNGGNNCDSQHVLNYLDNKCISYGECKDFVIKLPDKIGCIPDCPNQFNKGFDYNQGVKTCNIPSNIDVESLPISKCKIPNIRDFTNAGCLTNASDCKGYLINADGKSDNNGCVSYCPNGYIPSTDTNGLKICVNDYGNGNCDSHLVQYYFNNQCIQPSDCKDFIITLPNNNQRICIPDCPSSFQKGQDSVSKICQPPSGVDVNTLPISHCDPPQIRDFINAGCINSVSDCGGFIVNQNSCVSSCPYGFQAATDPSGHKMCVNNSNNNNNNGGCGDHAQNYLQGGCMDPRDCKNLLLSMPDSTKICIPECPSMFNLGYSDQYGVRTCQPPCNIDINSLPIANCKSPNIRDFPNAGCLQSISDCKGYIIQNINQNNNNTENACVSRCPNGYVEGVDKNGIKICQNNKENGNCDSSLVQNYLDQTCIQPQDCKDFLFINPNKNEIMCIPDCPNQFNRKKDSSGVTTCQPPNDLDLNSLAISKCDPPNIRDFTNAGCLQNVSSCNGYIVNQVNCVSACPYSYSADTNNGQKVCKNNKNQCGDQAQNYLQGGCMNPSDCKDYLLILPNQLICIPDCPQFFNQGYDNSLNIKRCTPPQNLDVQTLSISKCEPPNIRDFIDATCLNVASNCQGYIIVKSSQNNNNGNDNCNNNSNNNNNSNQNNGCVAKCPNGYVPSIDPSGLKICKNDNLNGNCDLSLAQNHLEKTCIYPNQCLDFILIVAENNKMICIPDCPGKFIQSFNDKLNARTCQPPNDIINYPIAKCDPPLIRDFINADCLTNQSDCKGYIVNQFNCLSKCPANYKDGQDNSGHKVCYSNNNNDGCGPNQAQNFLQGGCINPRQCRDFLIIIPNQMICIPDCPNSFNQGYNNEFGVYSCIPPANTNVSTLPISFCEPPLIKDFIHAGCLQNSSDCFGLLIQRIKKQNSNNNNNVNSTGNTIQLEYECVSQCPNGYKPGINLNGQNVCTNDFGNGNCDSSFAQNYLDDTCIKGGDCKDYLIKLPNNGQVICIPDCPSNFIKGLNQYNQNTCSVPDNVDLNSLPISNCNDPKIRDFTNAGCLNYNSDCKGYIIYNRGCVSKCPYGYVEGVDNSGQKVCYRNNKNNCRPPLIQNYLDNYCIYPQNCKDFIIQLPDQQMCIPDCPNIFKQTTDSSSNIRYCVVPSGTDVNNLPISKCEPPLIRDFIHAECLKNTTECQGYIIQQYNCVSQCPDNYNAGLDQNGNKICTNSNQGPNAENGSDNNCQPPLIQNLIDKVCIQINQCAEFYFTDGGKHVACIPQCPDKFIQGFDYSLNIKTCSLPPNTTLDQFQISNCKKVADFQTAGCLEDKSLCKGIYIESNQFCLSDCPSDYYQTTNLQGNQTCVKMQPFKLAQCSLDQVLLLPDNSCIIPNQCNSYLLKDAQGNQLCLPQCPLKAQKLDTNGKIVCAFPNDYVIDLNSLLNCTYPSIIDIDQLTCIPKIQDCKGYFYYAKRLCLQTCPLKTVKIIDSKTGVKYCSELEESGSAKCPPPLIQNFILGDCINSDECQYSLLIVNQGQICIPQCPSNLISDFSKSLNINTCTLPNGISLKDLALADCKIGIRDFINGQCLNNPQSCKGVVIEQRKACISQCPRNWTLIKSNDGYIRCIPPLLCQPTQIPDISNQICLDKISDCKGVWNPATQVCQKNCSQGYAIVFDQKLQVNSCVICLYKDEQGTCYLSCPQPLLSVSSLDPTQPGQCIQDRSNCKDYFTKALNTCEAQCRFGYSPINTTNPKTCIPCIYSGACNSTSQCNLYLASDLIRCDNKCPFGEIPQPKTNGQTYIQCNRCPQTNPYVSSDGTICKKRCDYSQVVDQSKRCIAPQSCNGVIYTDSLQIKYCLDRCPIGYIQVVEASTNLRLCKNCSGNTYFDPILNSCVQSCKYKDAKGRFCLVDLLQDCLTYISFDQTECLLSCPDGQYQRPLPRINQFQCVKQCDSNEFVFKNQCLKTCQNGLYTDLINKTCSATKPACSGVYSYDLLFCLPSCPSGQYPALYGDFKRCQICNKKLSLNGLICTDDCQKGEIYDLDLQRCITAQECLGKIITSDGKGCAKNCQQGQILSEEGVKKQCLSDIYQCKLKISSDLKRCILQCNDNEAAIQNGTFTICVACQFGVSDDGKSCRLTCKDSQLYDVDNKKCVNQCSINQYKSANGKFCVSSCIYPDLKRPNDNTQCYKNCEDGQIIDTIKGCISINDCQHYISSDKTLCINNCAILMEAVDSNNPKQCYQCPDNTFARLSNGIVVCQVISNDKAIDVSLKAEAIITQFQSITTITSDIKAQIKSQVNNFSLDIDLSITATLQDDTLSSDDKKKQTLCLLNKLENIGQQFLSKIDSSSASENKDNNKLALGNQSFSYFAEQKEEGKIFSTAFSLSDFFTLNSPNLQNDIANIDLSKTSKYFNGAINALSVNNILQNPHCSDQTKCGLAGLFTVTATFSIGKGRVLQEADNVAQFSLTYKIDPSKIDKTICVTYDPVTSAMSPSLATSINKQTNQITCTFTTNNSLFFDVDCSYISSTLCQQKATAASSGNSSGANSNNNTPTFSNRKIFSIIFLILLIFI